MADEQKGYPHTEDHKAKGDWNPLWEQFRHSCNLAIPILMEEVSKFEE